MASTPSSSEGHAMEARDEQFLYLAFGVDGEEYAIGILQVREIIGHRLSAGY